MDEDDNLDDAKERIRQNKNSFFFKAILIFLVFIFAIMMSLACLIAFNCFSISLIPVFYMLCSELAIVFDLVFIWPFRNYRFGSTNSFLAYYLVYIALTVIGFLLAIMLTYVFPDYEAKTDENDD
jgi:hypothetical protein